MLFRSEHLEGIRKGSVSLAFRRWRRPSVRSGSTLLTSAGQIEIRSVRMVDPEKISREDALRAGYSSPETLRKDLDRRAEGEVYRIELGALRPDPRIALREKDDLSPGEIADLRARLERIDRRSVTGSWTIAVLEVIEEHPATRAGDLCGRVGQEKEAFKLNVRKLKNLGLTESLGTGYRISPRGRVLLAEVRGDGGAGRGES